MTAVAATPTAVDWPKANVDAPDALHQMALVHFEVPINQLTVYDMRGYLKATYTLADHTLTGETLRATATHIASPVPADTADLNGVIEVRPARGCSCTGYKRTVK